MGMCPSDLEGRMCRCISYHMLLSVLVQCRQYAEVQQCKVLHSQSASRRHPKPCSYSCAYACRNVIVVNPQTVQIQSKQSSYTCIEIPKSCSAISHDYNPVKLSLFKDNSWLKHQAADDSQQKTPDCRTVETVRRRSNCTRSSLAEIQSA